jgi:hypothetical protein
MTCPFTTKPPPLQDDDRRGPFGGPWPPAIKSKAQFLDDGIVWSLFLKQLGGSEQEDAATITAFAERLGIDRGKILAKIETHFFDDNQSLH